MTVNSAPGEIVTLGKYKIVRELGRGSMGVVYEGFDPFLERKVALKTIRKDLLQLGGKNEADNMLQRFRREAQAAARLHHPNIVVVYDYAEEGDTVFIAMELVLGMELKDIFKQRQQFGLDAALDIMGQLLDGLAYSHRHGIVHRDIKPANIIVLDDGGQVKITDFGIARVDTSELTQAGEVMGTPTHMAPEQLLGQTVDGRADLFSAGVILYQLLTGEKPFTGGNITAVMHSVLTSDPIAPTQHNPQLPPQCDAIVAKALAKNAADRYQNAEEFKAALEELRALAASGGAPAPQPAVGTAPPATAGNYPATLEAWVELLTNQEMPIFSHTARRINEAMNTPASGAIEMARIIQQDPTLTAKLLKLGNSSYYNPSRQKLPNIGRAIIILGVKNIHNLALACSYVESATAGQNSEEVGRQIASSIHSAVQAKAFAALADDPFPEEVFVAALMHNFGRVAFWCHGKEACTQIRQRISAGASPKDAELAVLEFTLGDLDAALCKAWKLGGLIEECLGDIGPESNYRARLVHYSQQLADGLEQGLDSPAVQESLSHIAHITQSTPEALQAIVLENAERAVKVATQLGAGSIAHYIAGPTAQNDGRPHSGVQAKDIASVDQEERVRVLQEISNMLNGKIDLSMLFEKVMEGMQKAIHMDRVLFALITPDRSALREKSSKGMGAATRKTVMEFELGSAKNLFSHALAENGGSWIAPRTDSAMQKLFTPPIRGQLGLNECFIMPLSINKKAIGLFYADRADSQHSLDRQSLAVFVELVQQANIGVNLSKKQS